MTADDRVVHRFLLVAAWLPAALTALAVAAQLLALPHLPDPVAVHWGPDGSPDGFAAAWLGVLVTAVAGAGIPALIVVSTLPGLRRGDRGPSFRLMGAVAAALAALIAVLTSWSLLMQLGLADARDAPQVWAPLVAGYLAAIAAGAGAWFAQPAQRTVRSAEVPVAPLPLAADEHAVWMREATIARGGAIALGAALVLVVGLAVGTWLGAAGSGAGWISSAVALLLLALVATTTSFRVRVDGGGLHVASIAGLPRFRVPLADVAAVHVVDVQPMGEFGGWGIRYGFGRRLGIVLRTGPAIEVERRDGRRLVVTVDDAATGAALLEALARRGAAEPGGAQPGGAEPRDAR